MNYFKPSQIHLTDTLRCITEPSLHFTALYISFTIHFHTRPHQTFTIPSQHITQKHHPQHYPYHAQPYPYITKPCPHYKSHYHHTTSRYITLRYLHCTIPHFTPPYLNYTQLNNTLPKHNPTRHHVTIPTQDFTILNLTHTLLYQTFAIISSVPNQRNQVQKIQCPTHASPCNTPTIQSQYQNIAQHYSTTTI